MKVGPSARLVVARGPDAGAQVVVHAEVKIIGRAREGHLVLTDRSVSRHHFHIHATESGVYVRVCDRAAPLVIHEREVYEGDVSVGSTIVVGDTVLVVAHMPNDGTTPPPLEHHGATTLLPSLLTGQAGEVRGLAAVFALNRTLAGAETVPALEAALSAWAIAHVGCRSANVVDVNRSARPASDEDVVLEPLVERDGTTIFVPSHGAPSGWLAFTTSVAAHAIKDSHRRLLIIAGAICSSRLAQMSKLLVVEDEREAFRQQAVGSARAFLGNSVGADEIVRIVPKLAVSDVTVLLLGETGAGKSFVARMIHESGPRKSEPLRVINCAAIPESLIESELFGHARGAFTGAVVAKAGAFEVAGRGTLLLDEIGELPLSSQAKLLHVLEAKKFERLGSHNAIPLQARILAATNRDLEAMVANGTFRRDLYFRISVIKTTVPPLRERGDDIVILAQQLLSDLASNAGRRIRSFSPTAIDAIRRYPWPGNVRELRNVVEHALVLGEGPVIEVSDFPRAIGHASQSTSEMSAEDQATWVELPMNEDDLSEQNREAALRKSNGNKTRAAALLGIRRARLYPK